jgi:hypothetical protein
VPGDDFKNVVKNGYVDNRINPLIKSYDIEYMFILYILYFILYIIYFIFYVFKVAGFVFEGVLGCENKTLLSSV